MTWTRLLGGVVGLWMQAVAAQPLPPPAIVEGLRVPAGSNEREVRTAYGLTGPLVVLPNGRRSLRAEGDGIWFFFNDLGLNTNIRLDKPFAGTVRGIRIGDTLASVTARLGQPTRDPWKFGRDMARLYDLDQKTQIRFDISPDGRVVRMFVLLRRILS